MGKGQGMEVWVMAKRKGPKFVEAHRHALEIFENGVWRDYCTIRTKDEMGLAIREVDNGRGVFRIVEVFMGKREAYR